MSFFGQPQQQQPQSAFGGGGGGSAFGQPQPQQTASAFGAFGQQPQQQATPFGQPQQPAMGGAPGMPVNWAEFTDQLDVPVQCQLNDSVALLKFSPSPQKNPAYQQVGFRMLAAATWDGTILIFQVQHQDDGTNPVPAQIQQQFQQSAGCPILGMCWQEDQAAVLLACSDNTIKKFSLQSNQVTQVGQHAGPVKDVFSFIHQSGQSVVISGGWDCRVKFWSWQQGGQQLQQVGEAYVAMPVHYMSCQWPLLVTAHQDRFIHIWYLPENFQSNNWNPKEVTDSPLKFATTSICVFGDGKGYAVGSIEGRCGIKNYDVNNVQDKGKGSDFCFKCHREEQKSQNRADVYAVNGITFNTLYNTFATYGSEGTIIIWNKDTKAKYKASKRFPAPFTAANFTDDGKLLAYAIGYDWSKGHSGQRQANGQPYVNQIFVRSPRISDEVMKPPRR